MAARNSQSFWLWTSACPGEGSYRFAALITAADLHCATARALPGPRHLWACFTAHYCMCVLTTQLLVVLQRMGQLPVLPLCTDTAGVEHNLFVSPHTEQDLMCVSSHKNKFIDLDRLPLACLPKSRHAVALASTSNVLPHQLQCNGAFVCPCQQMASQGN